MFKIDTLTLKVNSINNGIKFYHDLLGFDYFIENNTINFYIKDKNNILITLIEDKDAIYNKKTTGLYHFALLFSSKVELSKVFVNIINKNYPIHKLSDHKISESIYLFDYDNNEVELYINNNKEFISFIGNKKFIEITSLDPEKILSYYDNSKFEKIDENVQIGHLHFHVRDVLLSKDFFKDCFKLDINQECGKSCCFLSNDKFHDVIAFNNWNGIKISDRKDNELGLVSYKVSIDSIKFYETISCFESKNINFEYNKKNEIRLYDINNCLLIISKINN